MTRTACDVQLRGVHKCYRMGRTRVRAVNGLDLDIQAGLFTVLSGPSGSGKSTVLNLIGGLDRPDEGQVRIDGIDLAPLKDDAATAWRGQGIGFVFQSFNLVPVLSAEDNVSLALARAGVGAAAARARARALLAAVGLEGMGRRRPSELSGGQQQRVAIARALVHEPRLVLADEPTANLDARHAAAALELLRAVCAEEQAALLLVSHDERALSQFPVVRDFADFNRPA